MSDRENIKLAKDALKSKNFVDALAACRAVLKVNPENVGALVMSASALKQLGNSGEAVQNLEKAVTLQPDLPTAWQGLATLLENAETRTDLERLEVVYKKLLDLFADDEEKMINFLGRQLRVQSSLEHYNDLVSTALRRVSVLKGKNQEESLQETYKYLSKGLLCGKEAPTDLSLVKESVIGGRSYEDQNLRSLYARLLESREDWSGLMEVLSLVAEENAWTSIYLCRLYIENVAWNLSLSLDEKAIEKAVQICDVEGYTLNAKGALAYKKGDFISARKLLCDGVSREKFLSAIELYYRTLVALGDWSHCVSFSKTVLQSGQGDPVVWKVRYAHGVVYTEQDKFLQGLKLNEETVKKVLNLCEQIPDSRGSSVEAHCHILLGSPAKALQTLKLKPLPYVDLERSIVHLKMWEAKGEIAKAESMCREILQQFDDWRVWLELGILLSSRGEKEEGLAALQKALRLNPESWEALYHLSSATEVSSNALKLLFRALKIQPTNRKVFEMALKICETLEDLEVELNLLETYCERSADFEAWRRLGIRKIEKDDGSGAVLALQNALRLNSKDGCVWTLLGEAYMLRGSYATAIKALVKASEFDPSPLPTCLLGRAHLSLGEAEEAAKIFELGIQKFCNDEKDHFLLCFTEGLAESQFIVARNAVESSQVNRGLEYFRKSYSTYMNLAQNFPEISLAWSGLAKNAHFLAEFKPEDAVEDPFDIGTKANACGVSVRCWLKVTEMNPECATSFRNLALVYLSQAESGSSNEDADTLRGLAVQAAVKALELESGSVDNWVALGWAAFKKGDIPLSQHAYIKALTLDVRNAEAWVGLGVLYLTKDQVVLAHKAFAQAQNSEPGFAPAWTGQGIIAEAVKPEEAMDLFRHALSVGGLEGAARGYGEWVLKSLKLGPNVSAHLKYALEELDALSTAQEHFEKMEARGLLDLWSTNTYGLLLERQGFLRKAKDCFQKANDLASESGSNSAKDAIYANLARCHILDDDYDSAIAYFSMIREATVFTTSSLGLAQHLGGYKEEAVATLEGAQAWLADSPETAWAVQEVLAKLRFEDCDIDEAIKLLKESSSGYPSSSDPLRKLLVLLTLESRTTDLDETVGKLRGRIGDRMPTGKEALAIAGALQELGIAATTFLKNLLMKWPNSADLWAAFAVCSTKDAATGSSIALKLSNLQDRLLSLEDLVRLACKGKAVKNSLAYRHLMPWIKVE